MHWGLFSMATHSGVPFVLSPGLRQVLRNGFYIGRSFMSQGGKLWHGALHLAHRHSLDRRYKPLRILFSS